MESTSSSSSSLSTRIIKILYEEECLNVRVQNDILRKATLKEYFPEDANLMYISNGSFKQLKTDDEFIFIKSHVDVYYLKIKKEEQSNSIRNSRSNLSLFKKIKKYFNQNYSYKVILQKLNKKYDIVVSPRTLSRILNENNLKRKNINESQIKEIVIAILLELEGSGFNLGYKTMCPVPGPNFVWHADGHDKLKRYGMAIYGFIDGFSRKILFLDVATSNNDPKIIAYYYLKLIEKYGYLPTLIRTDHGTEVTLMEPLHIAFRYNHTDKFAGVDSFLKGKSTHIQRIESYWRQFRQHMGDFYLNLFRKMESKNVLDVSNPLHIETLRYCFGPIIKEDILTTKKEWNEHRVRNQNCVNVFHGIPNELYHCPENVGAEDCKKPLIKEPIEKLLAKYAKEPVLLSSDFVQLLADMSITSTPVTAEAAFNLYLRIINAVDELQE